MNTMQVSVVLLQKIKALSVFIQIYSSGHSLALHFITYTKAV